MTVFFRLLLVWVLAWPMLASAEERVPAFSRIDSLDQGWEPLNFPDIERHSQYELVTVDGTQVVKAQTDASASGLVTLVRVPPETEPVLRWRWKVSNVYEQGDARRKSGDDYPARIYVAFEFEPDKAGFFERMKRAAVETFFDAQLPGNALNYIWANTLPQGSIVPNPFTETTRMVAVNSGPKQVGEWVTVERNIVADYREAFGAEPPPIVGIGIMSDSDNTGESATAWYGDIELITAPATGG
ncbi:DUF3047 domain-containing protein [Marinobacter sp.]|uniref:DUF3047 domain-containing protein n=1 Tax=Marinobacter sp. TaxID=50741 RepID=UPI0039AF2B9C